MNSIKFAILWLTLLFGASCASALNLMNYATNPGGEMEYVLFPEKDGVVYLCDTIQSSLDKDEILDAVESYLLTVKAHKGCELKNVMSTRRRYTADVEIGFGQRDLSFEVFGSPVAKIATDASKIKFNISALAKDSIAIITYSNFETNRTYLRGAAKNDGDPNIIQWQRVNALKAEAQKYFGKDNRDDRSDLYDLKQTIDLQHYLYANEANEFFTIVDDLRKSIGLDHDAIYNPEVVAAYNAKPITYKPIDLSTYKGCLLNQGNCVYVTGGPEDYEQSGAEELKKQIIMDGFWNTVPDPKYAHFIIEYHVETEGPDKAYLIIRDGNGERRISKFSGSEEGSSESISENREVAESLYKKALRKLQKRITEHQLPKQFTSYQQ